MATLLRTAAAKSARIFVNKSLLRQKFVQPCCYISTSKKNKDSLTTTSESPTAMEETEEYKKLKEHFADWDPEKPKVFTESSDFILPLHNTTFLQALSKSISTVYYVRFIHYKFGNCLKMSRVKSEILSIKIKIPLLLSTHHHYQCI